MSSDLRCLEVSKSGKRCARSADKHFIHWPRGAGGRSWTVDKPKESSK